MLKNILKITLLIIISKFTFAQSVDHQYFDIHVGTNFSTFRDNSRTLNNVYNYSFNPYTHIGYTRIKPSGFGYKLGVGYSSTGSTYDVKDSFTNKYTIHNFNISSMGVYGFEIIPFRDLKRALVGHIGMGINFGFPLFSSAELSIEDNSTEKTIRDNYSLIGKVDPVGEGAMKIINTSLSLEVGLRYNLNNTGMINFILGYNYGLYNMMREVNIPNRVYSRDLYIGIGYSIILHNLLFF